jgi:hypothetical protein
MVRDDPGGFVRVVANILPDKLDVGVTHQFARIERVVEQRGMRLQEGDVVSPLGIVPS